MLAFASRSVPSALRLMLLTLGCGETSISQINCAVTKGRFIRGEKQREIGDFFAGAVALHGYIR